MGELKRRQDETDDQNAARVEESLERYKSRHKAYYEANKERYKAYREANKERINEYAKAYREANKERIKERDKAIHKAYYEANKERIKARQKAYRGANKGRIKARRKAYYESHRARLCVLRVRSYEKRRFERTGIPLGMRVNSIGEEMVRICLDELGVPYKREKRFAWLRCEAQMRLDFYLPELNMAIEYDGIQHKELVAWYRIARKNTKFFGEAGFDAYKMRDALKDMLCTEHGIKVVRIDKSIDSLEKMRKVVREILTQRRMNYAVGYLLLVKDIETRRDEIGERKAHAEIMAALDAFDAIVADTLGALPH